VTEERKKNVRIERQMKGKEKPGEHLKVTQMATKIETKRLKMEETMWKKWKMKKTVMKMGKEANVKGKD
jgi:hypothetical protein